jgi:hypothetical protein
MAIFTTCPRWRNFCELGVDYPPRAKAGFGGFILFGFVRRIFFRNFWTAADVGGARGEELLATQLPVKSDSARAGTPGTKSAPTASESHPTCLGRQPPTGLRPGLLQQEVP